ncbi:MAG: hypothetical protein R3F48_16140 [Candidatus Zixiibacteriota bacterium]
MRKFTYMEKLLILVCIAVIGYSISGCAKKIVNDAGSTQLALSVPIQASKLAAATSYGRLTVTAPDIDTAIVREMMVIAGNLVLVGDTVSVPTGSARTLLIEGFAKDEILLYSGSITIDVTPGLTIVNVPLTPAVPMVNISPHFQEATFLVSDTFAIDVYAHGIDSLQSISFNMAIGDGPFNNYAIEKGEGLPDSAEIWNEGAQAFGLYMRGETNEVLTDANGNAHLATLRFYTYNDWSGDTAQVRFIPNISSMYTPSGLVSETVYTDDADILLWRPSIPVGAE